MYVRSDVSSRSSWASSLVVPSSVDVRRSGHVAVFPSVSSESCPLRLSSGRASLLLARAVPLQHLVVGPTVLLDLPSHVRDQRTPTCQEREDERADCGETYGLWVCFDGNIEFFLDVLTVFVATGF